MGDITDREENGELQPIVDTLASQHGIDGPFITQQSSDGSVFRYSFLAKGSVNAPYNRLREVNFRKDLEESQLLATGLAAHLSGFIPAIDAEVVLYKRRTPIVIAAVLLVSFSLLLFAFESIVVPLKAMLLNLISTTSAFGILVLAFQGIPLSNASTDCIQSFIPPLLFTILFGLSMDYHVFLLSRVKEEYDLCGDTTVAVRKAATATFVNITSAAAIMISVFLVIASLNMPMMRQLGMGLAAAVFLDATIIRCMLLPASMVLLGKWNWYCPSLLKKRPGNTK